MRRVGEGPGVNEAEFRQLLDAGFDTGRFLGFDTVTETGRRGGR